MRGDDDSARVSARFSALSILGGSFPGELAIWTIAEEPSRIVVPREANRDGGSEPQERTAESASRDTGPGAQYARVRIRAGGKWCSSAVRSAIR